MHYLNLRKKDKKNISKESNSDESYPRERFTNESYFSNLNLSRSDCSWELKKNEISSNIWEQTDKHGDRNRKNDNNMNCSFYEKVEKENSLNSKNASNKITNNKQRKKFTKNNYEELDKIANVSNESNINLHLFEKWQRSQETRKEPPKIEDNKSNESSEKTEDSKKKKSVSPKSKMYSDKFQISSNFDFSNTWDISQNSDSDIVDNENVFCNDSVKSVEENSKKKEANTESSNQKLDTQKNDTSDHNTNKSNNINICDNKFSEVSRKCTVIKLNGEIEEVDMGKEANTINFIPYSVSNINRSISNKRNNAVNTSSLTLNIDDLNDLPTVSEKVNCDLMKKCADAAKLEFTYRSYPERKVSSKIKLPVHGDWRNAPEVGREFTFASNQLMEINRSATECLVDYNFSFPVNEVNTNASSTSEHLEHSQTSKNKSSIQRKCSAAPITCESEDYYQTPRGMAKFAGRENDLIKFQLINTGIMCSFSSSKAKLIKSIIKPNVQSIKENLLPMTVKHSDNMMHNKIKNVQTKTNVIRSKSEILIGKILETGKSFATWNHWKNDRKKENEDTKSEAVDAENLEEKENKKCFNSSCQNSLKSQYQGNTCTNINSSVYKVKKFNLSMKSQNSLMTNVCTNNKHITSNRNEHDIDDVNRHKVICSNDDFVSIFKKKKNNSTEQCKTGIIFDPVTLLCKPGYVGSYLCRTNSSNSNDQIQGKKETEKEVKEKNEGENGNSLQQSNQNKQYTNYLNTQKNDITMKPNKRGNNRNVSRNIMKMEDQKQGEETLADNMYNVLHNSPTFNLDLQYMNAIFNEIRKSKEKNIEHTPKKLYSSADDKTATPKNSFKELNNQNRQHLSNTFSEHHEHSPFSNNVNEKKNSSKIPLLSMHNNSIKTFKYINAENTNFPNISNVSTRPIYVINASAINNVSCANNKDDSLNDKIVITNANPRLYHNWGDHNKYAITDKQLNYVKNYYTAGSAGNSRTLYRNDTNEYEHTINSTDLKKSNQKQNCAKRSNNLTDDKCHYFNHNSSSSQFNTVYNDNIRYSDVTNIHKANIIIKNNTNKFVHITNPKYILSYKINSNANSNANANNNYSNRHNINNYELNRITNSLDSKRNIVASNEVEIQKIINYNYLTNKNSNQTEFITNTSKSVSEKNSSQDIAKKGNKNFCCYNQMYQRHNNLINLYCKNEALPFKHTNNGTHVANNYIGITADVYSNNSYGE